MTASGRSEVAVRRIRAAATAAVVVGLDQLTKQWALARLEPGPCRPDTCIDVVGSLRFHLTFNSGASFSTGTGLGRWFALAAFVMTGYLVYLAGSARFRWAPLLLGAIAGGAVGNLIDRVLRAEDGWLTGAVVDFIDVQWWPIFNVADAAIVGGVIAVVATQLLWGEPSDISTEPDGTGAGCGTDTGAVPARADGEAGS